MLTVGAEVGAAAGNEEAADGRSAGGTGFAGTEIDFVFQLEESFGAIRVHVIGNGGAAERDGFPQHGLDGGMQALQFPAGEPASLTPGTNAGAKQAFVGIDIADAVEKFLVQ